GGFPQRFLAAQQRLPRHAGIVHPAGTRWFLCASSFPAPLAPSTNL
uniref:Uncharacterized protein n=1 Tax=Cyanoderma ruficeps TaxID=181631 RepID=A0A8C3R0F8_9PASS